MATTKIIHTTVTYTLTGETMPRVHEYAVVKRISGGKTKRQVTVDCGAATMPAARRVAMGQMLSDGPPTVERRERRLGEYGRTDAERARLLTDVRSDWPAVPTVQNIPGQRRATPPAGVAR